MPGIEGTSPRRSIAFDCGAPPLPRPMAPELVTAPDAPCELPSGLARAYWFTARSVSAPPPGSWTPFGRLSSCWPSRLADSECCLVTAAPPVFTADSPLRAASLSRLVLPIAPDRNRPVAWDTGAAADALGTATVAVPTMTTAPAMPARMADGRRANMCDPLPECANCVNFAASVDAIAPARDRNSAHSPDHLQQVLAPVERVVIPPGALRRGTR